jgi:hypothetical protein
MRHGWRAPPSAIPRRGANDVKWDAANHVTTKHAHNNATEYASEYAA